MQKDFEYQINYILSEVALFTEGNEQTDDITIVIIKKK
jgi:serine phosphatase RsbU (regulator of sigma subunit)